MSKGFFVTGTDTGVGKTLVTCALLYAFRARGKRVIGMKPVAAGAEETAAGLRNEDVERLIAASSVAAPRAAINPYCFLPPVAPHLAARAAGVDIELETIRRAYVGLAALADVVIVEGVGGFRVPLGARADGADLAAVLALPVVLVVGMRLGCLNHALLTAEAIRARGLDLAGWVANHIDGHMALADENVAVLAGRLSAPLLARIAYSCSPDARRAAAAFDLTRLT